MTSHWWTSHWKEGACGGDVNNRGPGVVWGGQTLTLNTWWLTPGVHTPCDPPFLCRQGLWLVGNRGEMMSECFHKHMIGLCDTIISVAMLISLPCWFWRRKVIVRCWWWLPAKIQQESGTLSPTAFKVTESCPQPRESLEADCSQVKCPIEPQLQQTHLSLCDLETEDAAKTCPTHTHKHYDIIIIMCCNKPLKSVIILCTNTR